MDKRKKLVKLFNDIKDFIYLKSLDTSPYLFLLNRFYLSLNNKRPSSLTLKGMTKSDFSAINKEFEDRLKRDFIFSLSLSAILSLPTKKVYEIENLKIIPKSSILILTDSVIIPYEIERKSTIFIGYGNTPPPVNPFSNIEHYPVSRDKPFSISLQSTLFDLISNDTTKLKPFSFDVVFDDAASYEFPSQNLIENISNFLKLKGDLHLIVKKNFLSSPLTKKNKKTLYSYFHPVEINRFLSFLHLKLEKKSESSAYQGNNIVIKDHIDNSILKLEKERLDFNTLLTFNDAVKFEQISILSKIESRTIGKSGEYFKFFLGFFKKGKITHLIENLRKSSSYRPFVRAKEIEPYSCAVIKNYIFPDDECFFQIPPFENFESKKLILRYLSVQPVFSYDDSGLFFLNDVGAIIPRTNDIDLLFAEGYFNSKVMKYYYKIKFPHHNKFLKKNFNSIPFFLCSKNIQKIIADLVKEIRSLNYTSNTKNPKLIDIYNAKMNQLDKFIYQLFKLTPEEIKIIEESLKQS